MKQFSFGKAGRMAAGKESKSRQVEQTEVQIWARFLILIHVSSVDFWCHVGKQITCCESSQHPVASMQTTSYTAVCLYTRSNRSTRVCHRHAATFYSNRSTRVSHSRAAPFYSNRSARISHSRAAPFFKSQRCWCLRVMKLQVIESQARMLVTLNGQTVTQVCAFLLANRLGSCFLYIHQQDAHILNSGG